MWQKLSGNILILFTTESKVGVWNFIFIPLLAKDLTECAFVGNLLILVNQGKVGSVFRESPASGQ